MYSLTKGNIASTLPTVQDSFLAGGKFYIFLLDLFFLYFFCALTMKRPSISHPLFPKIHATYERKRMISTVFFETTHKRLLSDGQ